LLSHQRFKLRSSRIPAPHDIKKTGGEKMEKEVLDKIETQITLESNMIPIKEENKYSEENTFWKYLDYSNWIPGEIEIEEDIFRDFE
jgi:ribonucleotide reductase beta subunit family protein with ferritin-like domain